MTITVTAASAALCSTDTSGLPAGNACASTTTVRNRAELEAWVAGPRTTNLLVRKDGGYDFAGAGLSIQTACDVTFNPAANFTNLGDVTVVASHVYVRNDLAPAPGPQRTFRFRSGNAVEVRAASTTQLAAIVVEAPVVTYRGDVGASAATVALCGDTVETGAGSELRVAELFITADEDLMLRGDVLGATSVALEAAKITLRPASMIGSPTRPVGAVRLSTPGRLDDHGDIHATGAVTIDSSTYRLFQQYSFHAGTCTIAGAAAPGSRPLVGCTPR